MTEHNDNQQFTLAYQNEDDRAYGLAGMAVSLAALDAIDRVAGISLDAEGPMVSFSHQYYFVASPSFSPKAAWDNLLQNFYITAAMALANVFSRSMVRLGREVPEEVLAAIRAEIDAEGRETCSLEDDEIAALYRKTFDYTHRIFANPRLRPAIRDFAATISRRRRLSGTDIRDELRDLHLI